MVISNVSSFASSLDVNLKPSNLDDHLVKVRMEWEDGSNEITSLNTKKTNLIISASGGPYKKDEIEVWLPVEHYYDRFGEGSTAGFSPNGNYQLPLPYNTAPLEANNYYYYTLGEKDGKEYYVIKNYYEVSGTTTTIEFQYHYYRNGYTIGSGDYAYLEDGTTLSTHCDVVYKANDETFEYETNDIIQHIDTDVSPNNLQVTVDQKYEVWDEESWGPKPEGSDQYFYIEWLLTYQNDYRSTQWADLYYNIQPDNDGEIVTWKINKTANKAREEENVDYKKTSELGNADSKSSTITYTDTNLGANSTGYYITSSELDANGAGSASGGYMGKYYDSRYDSVIIRYPRTKLEGTGDKIFKLKGSPYYIGTDGANKNGGFTEGDYTYKKVEFNYKGYDYKLWKTSSAYTINKGNGGHNPGGYHYSGARNTLDLKKDVEDIHFYVAGLVEGAQKINESRTKEYTAQISDDLQYLGDTKLNPGDFTFTTVKLENYIQRNYIPDQNKGVVITEDKELDNYPDLKVIGLDGVGNVLETHEINHDEITATFTTKPAKIIIEYTGKCDEVFFEAIVLGTLDGDSTHVQDILKNNEYDTKVSLFNFNDMVIKQDGGIISAQEALPELGDTEAQNKMEQDIEAHDMAKYGKIVAHDLGENVLSQLNSSGNLSIENSESPTYDYVHNRDTLHYKLRAIADWEIPAGFDKSDLETMLNYRPHNEDASFYVLLPKGTDFLEESLSIVDINGNVVEDYSIQYIPKWKGSSQTMVVITPKMASGVNNEDINTSNVDTGYTVYFDLNYDHLMKFLFGTVVNVNSAYMISDDWDQNLPGGYPDNGGSNSIEIMTDLDQSGDESENNTTYYANKTNTLDAPSAITAGLMKNVKNSDDLYYSDQISVKEEANYTYRLVFTTDTKESAKDVIIYDSFENSIPTDKKTGNEYWKGTFQGIDTTYLEAMGCKPVVYYSTVEGLAINDTTKDLTNGVWSTTPPSNLSEVTAVAVDCRKDENDANFIFPEKTGCMILVDMKAPVDNNQESYKAYNSSWFTMMASISGSEYQQRELLESKTTAVELVALPRIEKASTPEGASSKAGIDTKTSAVIQHNGTIQYQITVNNINSIATLKNIVVVDEVQDDLTIIDADIPGHLEDINGQKVTFTISSLAPGESVTMTIDTKAKATEDTYYKNQAAITKVDGVDITDIESNEVHHKAVIPTANDFAIEKSADPAGASSKANLDKASTGILSTFPDGTITYSVKVSNNSKFDYNDLKVTDTLPEGLKLVVPDRESFDSVIKYYVGTDSSDQKPCVSPNLVTVLKSSGEQYDFTIRQIDKNSSITLVIPVAYKGLTATTDFMNKAKITEVAGFQIEKESNEVWHRAVKKYKVTYEPGIAGSTTPTGDVPIDSNLYEGTATAIVRGNDGNNDTDKVLSAPNYKFVGWKADDGSDTIYNSTETYTLKNKDVVFTAQWEIVATSITIYKKDGTDGPNKNEKMSNVQFELTKDNDPTFTTQDKATDTVDGKVTFDNLTVGKYILRETKTNAGYQLPYGYWEVTVSEDVANSKMKVEFTAKANATGALPPAVVKQNDYTFVIYNYETYDLPSTGGNITPMMVMLLGIGLVGLAYGLRKKTIKGKGEILYEKS